MTDSVWTSVVLVVATALATGTVSFLVAWQQNSFAERRAERERAQTVEDRRAADSREHARRLHAALEELIEMGDDALRNNEGPPQDPRARAAYGRLRGGYLLVGDERTRASLANGLTIIVNPSSRSVKLRDWREAVATTTFVLSAYLRGDEPLGEYEVRLRELRKLYTPSGSSSDSA